MIDMLLALSLTAATVADAEGCADHPAISRYPGMQLAWCETQNFTPFRVPLGPVTGYRTIGTWEDTEGRLTRNFYAYRGEDRTHAEVWKNISDALKEAGFEIVAEGLYPDSNVRGEVGGRSWQDVYFRNNELKAGGAPVATMLAGTATSGGSGAVVASRERADDTLYVVVNVEQHSDRDIGVLIDVMETKPAETGLVVADAEAMGRDIEERGRTVIEGLMFAHDDDALLPGSDPALTEAARLLAAMPDKSFYVVGHTDATGTHAYNMKLSADRAHSVREALVERFGIAPERLIAAGVGPLSPVLTNSSDGGRAKNRRVELVEQ